MREKGPILIVLLNLTVFASAVAAVPHLFYSQIPHLAGYEDTRLVDENLDATYAPSLCRLSVIHKQTLETSKYEGDVWQRLPGVWQGRAQIKGRGDEAAYETGENGVVKVTSRVSFGMRRPLNVVLVRNRFSFQLPERLCPLFVQH